MRPLSEGARSAFKKSSEAQSWKNKQAQPQSAYLALINSAPGPRHQWPLPVNLESFTCCRQMVSVKSVQIPSFLPIWIEHGMDFAV